MQIKLVTVNCRFTHSCLALFYLRTEVAKHLPAAELILQQFALNDPYYPTLLRIAEGAPAVIFFSVYIWNSAYIERLSHDLRRLLPETSLVLGGPQVSHLEGRGDFPAECSIVRGEIEGVPADFYEDLQAGNLQPEYRGRGGRPFPSPYIEEDFAGPLQNRQVYYESSRGCPFACTYCLSSVERGVRVKDLPQVREELRAILRHRPPVIRFVDRTFNAQSDRALALWRFLAEEGGETVFHFEIAPELFTEEMFAFLEQLEPGRFQFEIGLQSTNPETLAAIGRPASLDVIGANLARLRGMENIHLHVDLILGLPFETRQSFRRSFNEVFNLKPHYIQMGLLKILPGTAMARAGEEYGLVACRKAPYEILATRWLGPAELAELYWFGEGVEAFCNNRFFSTLLDAVRRREADPFTFFQDLLAFCRRHHFFELAKTQELMGRLLAGFAQTRGDGPLLAELLLFDWLRSGQRGRPDFLDWEAVAAAKNTLRKGMPQDWPPHYTYRTRDRFFKLAHFARFSGAALKETGLADQARDGYVCFLPQEAPGLLKQQQVVLVPFDPLPAEAN